MSVELETVSVHESSDTSSDAFDNAALYAEDINEEGTKTDDDQYKTDSTVPVGWIYKGVLGSGKNFLLKCPQGNIYRSRADAFEKMYSSGQYSQEETETLKHCLKYEGWEDNDDIPRGWKIKRGKHIHLLEQGGKKFRSALKAYEFVKKHSRYYSTEGFNRLQILSKGSPFTECRMKKQRARPVSMSSWSTDETVYPKGWKYKEVEKLGKSYHRVLAPGGLSFAGVRTALEHIIKNKYPESDIAMLRTAMKNNHWKTNESVPPNWFFKTRGSLNAISIVDHEGKVYQSREEAISKISDKSFVTQIRNLNIGNVDKSSTKHMKTSANKIFWKRPRKMSNEWQVDESLYPSGWKYVEVRRVLWGQTSTYHRLKSPDGALLGGVRAALQHMIKNDYAETDVERMRSAMTMIMNKWKTDEGLPLYWFYKRDSKYGLKFVDNKGNLYKSREQALNKSSEKESVLLKEFLLNHKENALTESILVHQKDIQDGSSPPTLRKYLKKDWLTSSLFPNGWMFKQGKKDPKQITLLSPNESIHIGVRKALSYMIQNKFPEDHISIMRTAMGQRGWSEHESLPENWLYRKDGRAIKFCDARACYYRSKKIALKSDNYESDLDKVRCFRSLI